MMLLKKGALLPDEDHVVRFISPNRLIKNEHGKIEILPQAFILREKDKGRLSVSWLEYFDGDQSSKLSAIKNALAKGWRHGKLPSKGALGTGNVAEIKTVAPKAKPPLRIVYAPSTNNPAHSSIVNMPNDDKTILESLATDVFVERVQVKDI